MVRIVAYIQAVVDGVLAWRHGGLLLRRRVIRKIRNKDNRAEIRDETYDDQLLVAVRLSGPPRHRDVRRRGDAVPLFDIGFLQLRRGRYGSQGVELPPAGCGAGRGIVCRARSLGRARNLGVDEAVDGRSVGDEGREEELDVGDVVGGARALVIGDVHDQARHGHGDDGEADQEEADKAKAREPGAVDLGEIVERQDHEHHIGDHLEDAEDEELDVAGTAFA